jgi:DnaJ-class molecular chaperone
VQDRMERCHNCKDEINPGDCPMCHGEGQFLDDRVGHDVTCPECRGARKCVDCEGQGWYIRD